MRPTIGLMRLASDRPHGDPDRTPPACPYGDPLGKGTVLVGWAPCGCPEALKGHKGHRTYSCRACWEQRHWQTVCYYPPHLGEGHPVNVR